MNLLLPDGWLSMDTIKRYIDKKISNEENDLIIKHLKECDLCKDAVEGYQTVAGMQKVNAGIEELKKRFSKKSNKSTKTILFPGKRLYFLSIAASIAILTGLFFLYNNFKMNSKKIIADHISEKQIHEDASVAEKSIPVHPVIKEKSEVEVLEEFYMEEELRIVADDIEVYEEEQSIDLSSGIAEGEEERMKNEEFPGEPAVSENKVLRITETSADEVVVIGYGTQQKAASESAGSMKKSSVKSDKVAEISGQVMAVPMEGISEDEETTDTKVYITVEEMPKFKGGGIEKFHLYVMSNIVYPKEAIEMNLEGKVMVKFIVSKEGKVVDTEILRGVHPLLDSTALKIIQSSPQWSPGKQKSEPVHVSFTIPVIFKLQTEVKE